jgi:hypothetical protein
VRKKQAAEPEEVIYCRQCGRVEEAWNPRLKKITPVKHGEGIRDFLCSDCIARGFMKKDAAAREQLKREAENAEIKSIS